MSAVLPQSGADPVAAARPAGGFFAHHGIWAPGVRLLRNLGFTAKAVIISLAFMLPMLVLLGALLYGQAGQSEQARRDALRQQVELAHGLVAWAHAQQQAGSLGREQAQSLALRALAALRHGDGEAFWVGDLQTHLQPHLLLHPLDPDAVGRDVGGVRDADGQPLYLALAEAVRRDGRGFVAYRQAAAGGAPPAARLAYVQGFGPWGWMIGSALPTDDLRSAAWRQAAWVLGALLLVQGVAGYLFLSFHRVMDGGLRETRRHLGAMSAGDLTTSPRGWGRDETALLMEDLRAMQVGLRRTVTSVRRSSAEIVDASTAIADGAADLAQRTEHAALQLETSAQSMRRMSAAVDAGAEHAEQASAMARRHAAIAAEGGTVMREVVATIDDIRAASARIGEIVGTIDGIAFQTNILALNAAVEAARAGPQGRGFAVVAAEVRTLAQRSAEAAREIKVLIQGSVQQVEAGTRIVSKAGAAMNEIVGDSQRIDELLGRIATGAREQSTGIGQVGQAVQALDRVTHDNAALVERNAASAAAMRELATALAAEVARFRLPAAADA